VTVSFNDPFPGWIDNFYGVTGILIGGGKGVLRVFNASKYICLDAMPVDIVIKSIIITTWKLGLNTYDYQQKYQCISKYAYLIALSYKYEKESFLSSIKIYQHFRRIVRILLNFSLIFCPIKKFKIKKG